MWKVEEGDEKEEFMEEAKTDEGVEKGVLDCV